jgi:sugar phosphate isomerase/epimerase
MTMAEPHALAREAFLAMVDRAAAALYQDCANYHHKAQPFRVDLKPWPPEQDQAAWWRAKAQLALDAAFEVGLAIEQDMQGG